MGDPELQDNAIPTHPEGIGNKEEGGGRRREEEENGNYLGWSFRIDV